MKFSVGQKVKLALSGETGVMIGRAEYATESNSYLVRYVTGEGRQIEQWWSESALEAAE